MDENNMNDWGATLMNSVPITAHGQSIPIQWIDVHVAGIKVSQQNDRGLRACLKNYRPPILANRVHKTYREPSCSARGRRVFNAGAWPQGLLWASTGIKGRKATH
jgi:hypothetical protein